MHRVSRPNSAWNTSYDVRREVGETVLPKVPMKRGPLSGDANFADLDTSRVRTTFGHELEQTSTYFQRTGSRAPTPPKTKVTTSNVR